MKIDHRFFLFDPWNYSRNITKRQNKFQLNAKNEQKMFLIFFYKIYCSNFSTRTHTNSRLSSEVESD